MSRLGSFAWRLRRSRFRRDFDRDDLISAFHLGGLLPAGTIVANSAMAPRTLLTIANFIQIRGAREIVECGPGVSTIVLAGLERHLSLGLKVTSFEEDNRFASSMANAVRDLNSFVIHHSALSLSGDRSIWGGEPPSDARWYTLPRGRPDTIDVLIVDGPASRSGGKGLERWPALPIFFAKLGADSMVVLDDVGRRGEFEVMRGWKQFLGPDFSCVSDGRAAFFLRNLDPSPFAGRIIKV